MSDKGPEIRMHASILHDMSIGMMGIIQPTENATRLGQQELNRLLTQQHISPQLIRVEAGKDLFVWTNPTPELGKTSTPLKTNALLAMLQMRDEAGHVLFQPNIPDWLPAVNEERIETVRLMKEYLTKPPKFGDTQTHYLACINAIGQAVSKQRQPVDYERYSRIQEELEQRKRLIETVQANIKSPERLKYILENDNRFQVMLALDREVLLPRIEDAQVEKRTDAKVTASLKTNANEDTIIATHLEKQKPIIEDDQRTLFTVEDYIRDKQLPSAVEVLASIPTLTETPLEYIERGDPLVVLARLRKPGNISQEIKDILNARFGGIVDSQGAINEQRFLEIAQFPHRYWGEKPPGDAEYIPIDQVPMFEESHDVIKQIVAQIPLAKRAFEHHKNPRQEIESLIEEIKRNPSLQMRLAYTPDQLKAISHTYNEEDLPNMGGICRLIDSKGKLMDHEQTFDTLINSFHAVLSQLPPEKRQAFLDQFANEKLVEQTQVPVYPPKFYERYEQIAVEYRASEKWEPGLIERERKKLKEYYDTEWFNSHPSKDQFGFNNIVFQYKSPRGMIKGIKGQDESYALTCFDLCDLINGKSKDYLGMTDAERKEEFGDITFLKHVQVVSERYKDFEPAFAELYTHVEFAMKIDKKDFIDALNYAKSKLNIKQWEHMKQIGRAYLCLEDIGFAANRKVFKETKPVGTDEPAIVHMVNIFPELEYREAKRTKRNLPTPISTSLPKSDENPTQIIGPNGSGKSTLARLVGWIRTYPPLVTSIGKNDGRMRIDQDNRGDLLPELFGAKANFSQNELPIALLSKALQGKFSHFQEEALKGYIALRLKNVFLDELTGTPDEWLVPIYQTLYMLGLREGVNHSSYPITRGIKTLQKVDPSIKIASRCMKRRGVVEDDLVLLSSNGARLTAEVGADRAYLKKLFENAREMGYKLALPKELLVIGDYLREHEIHEGGLSVNNEAFTHFGYGEEGEISLAVSKLSWERAHTTQGVLGSDALKSEASIVKNHMSDFLKRSMNDTQGLARRNALMRLFLEQSHIQKIWSGKNAHSILMAENYRMMSPLLQINSMLEGNRHAAISTLLNIDQYRSGKSKAFFDKLFKTNFFQQSQVILESADDVYSGLQKLAGNKAEMSTRISAQTRFKLDVMNSACKGILQNADLIAGITRNDRALEKTIIELEKTKVQLHANLKEASTVNDRRLVMITQGLYDGFNPEEVAHLEEVFTKLTGGKITLTEGIKSVIQNQGGYKNISTDMASFYFVLRNYAGNKVIGEVCGRSLGNPTGEQSTITYHVDTALKHTAQNSQIEQGNSVLNKKKLDEKKAALFVGRLLAMADVSVPEDHFEWKLLQEWSSFINEPVTRFVKVLSDSKQMIQSGSSFHDISAEIEKVERELDSTRQRFQTVQSDMLSIEAFKDILKVNNPLQISPESYQQIIDWYNNKAEKVPDPLKDEFRKKLPADFIISLLCLDEFGRSDSDFGLGALIIFAQHKIEPSQVELKSGEVNLTLREVAEIVDKLPQNNSAKNLLERYVGRLVQDEVEQQILKNKPKNNSFLTSKEIHDAFITLGFADFYGASGHYGEGKITGDTIELVDAINPQVLAKNALDLVNQSSPQTPLMMSEALATAGSTYKPANITMGSGVHVVEGGHGIGKTTLQNTQPVLLPLYSTWGIGTAKNYSSPEFSYITVIPPAATGLDASAFTNFAVLARQAIQNARIAKQQGKKCLVIIDESGGGTDNESGAVVTRALLETLAEIEGVDMNVICQNGDVVRDIKDKLNAHLWEVTPERKIRPVDGFVDPKPLETLAYIGWPPEAIKLVQMFHNMYVNNNKTRISQPISTSGSSPLSVAV